MNINELNAKLVSELREIARLIGIADVEKLRKQELVKKIVETGEEEAKNAAPETEAPAEAPAGAAGERLRHGARADGRLRRRRPPRPHHAGTGHRDDAD